MERQLRRAKTNTKTRKQNMKRKSKKSETPRCVFCGSTGPFAIFSPRFKPFGTACVACEESLPAGTELPIQERCNRLHSANVATLEGAI